MNPTDLLNVGSEIEWRGATYRVKKLSVEQMFVFGDWLANRAKLSAMRTKDAPEELLKMQLSVVNADVAAGKYEPAGEYYLAACYTIAGAAKVLHLSIDGQTPPLTEDDCLELVKAKVGEALDRAAESVGDGGKVSSAQEGPSATGATASGGASSTAGSRGPKSSGGRRSKSGKSSAAS